MHELRIIVDQGNPAVERDLGYGVEGLKSSVVSGDPQGLDIPAGEDLCGLHDVILDEDSETSW
jgi:hypothetical protein